MRQWYHHAENVVGSNGVVRRLLSSHDIGNSAKGKRDGMASDNKPTSSGTATRPPRGSRTTGTRPPAPAPTKSATTKANVAAEPHVQPRRAERRPELIKQRREERLKIVEKQRKQRMVKRLALGALALLVVAGVVYTIVAYVRDREDNAALANVQEYNYDGGQHADGTLAYTETPPVGGTHNSAWQNCGYYDAPIASENAVHSLEHGAVWITYRPDLPADQIDTLRQLTEGQTYLLVSPFPDLPAPVVASSWNRQLQLQSATDPGLDAFIQEFRQGPETPERGASCSGGVSTTIG